MRTQGGEELRILFSKVGRVVRGVRPLMGQQKFELPQRGAKIFRHIARGGAAKSFRRVINARGGVQNVRRGENFLAFPVPEVFPKRRARFSTF